MLKKKVAADTLPRNGTPEQCWNDQMHKVLLQMVHAALAEVTNQGPILRRSSWDPADFLRFPLISNNSYLFHMNPSDL